MERAVIYVANAGEGWHLVHEGRKVGPYSSENEANLVAHEWAKLAMRRGLQVEVVHQSGKYPEEQLSEALQQISA